MNERQHQRRIEKGDGKITATKQYIENQLDESSLETGIWLIE